MSSPPTPSGPSRAQALACPDCGSTVGCRTCWRLLTAGTAALIIGWLQLLYLAIQGLGR